MDMVGEYLLQDIQLSVAFSLDAEMGRGGEGGPGSARQN